jgi:hypothetical protein
VAVAGGVASVPFLGIVVLGMVLTARSCRIPIAVLNCGPINETLWVAADRFASLIARTRRCGNRCASAHQERKQGRYYQISHLFYSFCFGTFGSGLARQHPNTAEKRVRAFFRLRMGWHERWVFSPPEFTL